MQNKLNVYFIAVLFLYIVSGSAVAQGYKYYLEIYNITTGKKERLNYTDWDLCKKHEAGFSRVGSLTKKCTAY